MGNLLKKLPIQLMCLTSYLAIGIQFNKENLSILSAYFLDNINRFGVFELSRSKDTSPLAFVI